MSGRTAIQVVCFLVFVQKIVRAAHLRTAAVPQRRLSLAIHSSPYNSVSGFWAKGNIGPGEASPCPDTCVFEGKVGFAKAKMADAVIVDNSYGFVPNWKKPVGQVWIGLHWEAPANFQRLLDAKYMQHFDYTSSYRADADVPVFAMIPDNFTSKIKDLEQTAPTSLDKHRPNSSFVTFSDKRHADALMSAWISNCDEEHSGRLSLMRSLQLEGISVASYGACLRNRWIPKGSHKGPPSAQKVQLSSRYPFLFAAENAFCPHYHTEKVYQAFLAGVVPVYVGDDDTIDEWIPANSTIKAADFDSPAALAAHLKRVAGNEELYNSYFRWRGLPLPPKLEAKIRNRVPTRCQVCSFLHAHTARRSAPAEVCKSPQPNGLPPRQ